MRRLVLLLTTVLALLLLSTTAALAQDKDDTKVVFCGTLAEADCALLNQAQTALWSATSGETASTVSVILSGLPRISDDEPALTVANRSAFVADPETIDQMLSLQDADLEALAEDPEALQDAMLLSLSIDAASATNVLLSPDLRGRLSDLIGRDVPSEFVYETRLIDGVAYINVSPFAEFIPQIDSLGDWIGIDLMAFMPMIMESRIAEGDLELDELEESLQTPGQALLAQPYLVMIQPEREALFNEFLEILPLRDASIDGQVAAVYRMKMDVPGYTRSPIFLERMPGLGQTISEDMSADMQPEEAGRNITGTIVQGIGFIVLRNADAMVIQGIGYEDAHLYAMEMNMGLELAGKGVDVIIQSRNANVNRIESVPVPENAFVPPIRLILGLIETFGSGE